MERVTVMSEQIFSRKQSFGTPGRVALDTFDHVGQFAKFRLGNRYAFLTKVAVVLRAIVPVYLFCEMREGKFRNVRVA